MDNRSAIRYLSTCKQLHSLYHTFPLNEPIRPYQIASMYTTHSVLGRNCCSARSPILGIRSPPVPRIIRPRGWYSARYVAALQHVEEVRVHDYNNTPLAASIHELGDPQRFATRITQCKLPAAIRTLQLALYDYRQLSRVGWPPQLTALALSDVTEVLLQPGVLPATLETLCMSYKRDVVNSTDPRIAIQPIAAGVLPPQLQQLQLTWNRSLADLALPPSLTRLELVLRSELLIPAGSLPSTLRVLSLNSGRTEFDTRTLIGVLPSSVRVLRLHCKLMVPPSAELFAQVPQLEELDLAPPGVHSHWVELERTSFTLMARALRSVPKLRTLRLGSWYSPTIPVDELPLSLPRLVVVASEEQEEVLVPLQFRHAGLVVEFESPDNQLPSLYEEGFEDARYTTRRRVRQWRNLPTRQPPVSLGHRLRSTHSIGQPSSALVAQP